MSFFDQFHQQGDQGIPVEAISFVQQGDQVGAVPTSVETGVFDHPCCFELIISTGIN